MSKSRYGVCDICGCAVVRLEDGDPIVSQEVDCFSGMPITKNVWTTVKIPEKGQFTVNGHTYQDKNLIQVRCAQHQDNTHARPGLDAKGGSGVERNGYCVREIKE